MLKERVLLPVEISQFFPSTQLCSNPECTFRGPKGLTKRVHAFPECRLVLDRDVNAARNLEQEGVRLVSADNNLGAERYRSHARGDLPAILTDRIVYSYNTIPGVRARWVDEAGSFLRSGW